MCVCVSCHSACDIYLKIASLIFLEPLGISDLSLVSVKLDVEARNVIDAPFHRSSLRSTKADCDSLHGVIDYYWNSQFYTPRMFIRIFSASRTARNH